MTVFIEKSRAEGTIIAPRSKSDAHRAMICAALCNGKKSVIEGIFPCDDLMATMEFLMDLGTSIRYEGGRAEIWGINAAAVKPMPVRRLNCRESGSTLRFLLPLLWLTGNEFFMRGSERLISRPMDVYEQIAKERGFRFEKMGDMIFTRGKLTAGEYRIPGNVSSQFITGLIFALSTLKDDSRIILTTDIESRGYIDITIGVLKSFGIEILWKNESTIFIKGGQQYQPTEYSVEGDWSNSAFLEAFNCIGGNVEVTGLNTSSMQPDRAYREHFKSLCNGFCEINLENCPDLGPILFTLAAIKDGARFIGTKRLTQKESDRVAVMKEELEKFGAKIYIEENAVEIKKSELDAPSDILYGHNDHRVVMSLALLCSIYGGGIKGSEAVNKSYPTFFDNIRKLGINANESD